MKQQSDQTRSVLKKNTELVVASIIEKIGSSIWIISPNIAENKKCLSCHHLAR